MPIFEFECHRENCSSPHTVYERFFHRRDVSRAEEPDCPHCGTKMDRVMKSAPRMGIMGLLERYNDRSKEGGYARGHWVWQKKGLDGLPMKDPKPLYLETVQQQREFCKQEGLVPPDQIGEMEVDASGKGIQTAGIKSNWI